MFRIVSVAVALLCLALFTVFLLNSGFYVDSYGIPPDVGADFLGRREAPMFLGFAILLWLARDIPVGRPRDAICYGMAATWLGIAMTGVYEFVFGTAAITIVLAAAFETALALLFLVARTR